MFAEGPITPQLLRKDKIGRFRCRLYHDGQVLIKRCKSCGSDEHHTGELICPHYKENTNVISFAGYSNPLSNFFMPEEPLEIFGRQMKTAEHAWVYRKATDNGFLDIAEDVLACSHGGKAFLLSKDIESKIQPGWASFNLEIMENILCEKAAQCEQFREALRESGQKLLAHAVPDKFWGTGLTPISTDRTDPKYWPGANQMGILLMKVRDTLFAGTNVSDIPPPESTTTTSGNEVNDENPVTTHDQMSVNSDSFTLTYGPAGPPPTNIWGPNGRRPVIKSKPGNTSMNAHTPQSASSSPVAPSRKRRPTSEPPGAQAPNKGRLLPQTPQVELPSQDTAVT